MREREGRGDIERVQYTICYKKLKNTYEIKNNYAIFGTLFNLSWIRNIYKHYNGQFKYYIIQSSRDIFLFCQNGCLLIVKFIVLTCLKNLTNVCTGKYDRNFVTVLYQFYASKHF